MTPDRYCELVHNDAWNDLKCGLIDRTEYDRRVAEARRERDYEHRLDDHEEEL